MKVELFTLVRAKKLTFVRVSLKTDMKIHFGCVNAGNLK